jgi:hypothetical protein
MLRLPHPIPTADNAEFLVFYTLRLSLTIGGTPFHIIRFARSSIVFTYEAIGRWGDTRSDEAAPQESVPDGAPCSRTTAARRWGAGGTPRVRDQAQPIPEHIVQAGH